MVTNRFALSRFLPSLGAWLVAATAASAMAAPYTVAYTDGSSWNTTFAKVFLRRSAPTLIRVQRQAILRI